MKISGEVQPTQLADLFQWIANQRKTGRLSLVTETTERVIYFSQGFIASSEANTDVGAEGAEKVRFILKDALRWDTGQFEFVDLPLPANIATENLKLAIGSFFDEISGDVVPTKESATSQVAGSNNQKPMASAAAVTAPRADLRSMIIDRLWTGKFKTPLLPTVATKVMEITRRENYSLKELSQVILTDQVIAAHVLKHANSPMFGGSQKIDNLPMAFQRIGSDTVTKLVFALSLQGLKSDKDIFLDKKNLLWKHSAACALFARFIALPVRLDHNLAFLCGLMQDFGKIILLSIIQEAYGQSPGSRPLPDDAVEKILAVYHPMVGSMIGKKWNLPIQVITAMSHHHTLTAPGELGQYAAIANLSDAFATLLTKPAEDDTKDLTEGSLEEYLLATELESLPASKMLRLSAEQLAAIIARAPECLHSAQELVTA